MRKPHQTSNGMGRISATLRASVRLTALSSDHSLRRVGHIARSNQVKTPIAQRSETPSCVCAAVFGVEVTATVGCRTEAVHADPAGGHGARSTATVIVR